MSGNAEGGNPQRWWESYLVRYFLGFIVGTVCVLILVTQSAPKFGGPFLGTLLHAIEESPTSDQPSPANTLVSTTERTETRITINLPEKSREHSENPTSILPVAIAFSLLGMGYCYVASTPITVLHSARMLQPWISIQARAFWMGWVISLLYTTSYPQFCKVDLILLLFASYAIALVTSNRSTRSENQVRVRLTGAALIGSLLLWAMLLILLVKLVTLFVHEIPSNLLAFSMPIIWLVIGQYWVLLALQKDTSKMDDEDSESKFLQFYISITKARQLPGSRDIRDSYSHLREHSNSVFVVLIELCALAALLCLQKVAINSNIQTVGNGNSFYWTLALIAIGIWLIPTVFMWGLANRLEKVFASKPELFILKNKHRRRAN